jgi:hypothetical protein
MAFPIAIGAAIVTGIVDLWGSWIDSKKAKHQAEAAFQTKLADNANTWDIMALRMSQFSWKDELITIVIFGPLIAAFLPILLLPTEQWQAAILLWVDFVTKLPLWYQSLIMGIAAASFGIRWMVGRGFSKGKSDAE